jgi:hypothetical protein
LPKQDLAFLIIVWNFFLGQWLLSNPVEKPPNGSDYIVYTLNGSTGASATNDVMAANRFKL